MFVVGVVLTIVSGGMWGTSSSSDDSDNSSMSTGSTAMMSLGTIGSILIVVVLIVTLYRFAIRRSGEYESIDEDEGDAESSSPRRRRTRG